MKKNGFTIVELLAVLIVLGIIVGITISTVNSSSDNAKKKSEEVFISSLKSAIETYLETDGITELKANEFVAIQVFAVLLELLVVSLFGVLARVSIHAMPWVFFSVFWIIATLAGPVIVQKFQK